MGTFVGTLLKHVGTAGAVNIEINLQSSEKSLRRLQFLHVSEGSLQRPLRVPTHFKASRLSPYGRLRARAIAAEGAKAHAT